MNDLANAPENRKTKWILIGGGILFGVALLLIILIPPQSAEPVGMADGYFLVHYFGYAPVVLYAPKDTVLAPHDLVSVNGNATLSFAFAEEPQFTRTGWHEVAVVITCEWGTSAQVTSRVFVYDVYTQEPIVFAGYALRPEMLAFATAGASFSSAFFDTLPDVYTPGWQDVLISVYNSKDSLRVVASRFYVQLTPGAVQTFLGEPVSALDFVRWIQEEDAISVQFAEEPDLDYVGEQYVTIVLADTYGNTSAYTVTLTIRHDTEPPVLTGNVHRTMTVGGAVDFASWVTATDNYDPEPFITVDYSSVDVNRLGTQTVVFTAEDFSGNTTRLYGTLTVRARGTSLITMAEVEALADDILAQILTPNMTERQQAYAIFAWVTRRVNYTVAVAPRNDIALGAYTAIRQGRGDCYVYMAISHVLLTQAGFESVPIWRLGGVVEHYWNLVNLGDGWFHFDATPMLNAARHERFMFGESRARYMTRRAEGRLALYVYDATLFPEVEWYC